MGAQGAQPQKNGGFTARAVKMIGTAGDKDAETDLLLLENQVTFSARGPPVVI